jgi:hypothetical protein
MLTITEDEVLPRKNGLGNKKINTRRYGTMTGSRKGMKNVTTGKAPAAAVFHDWYW